MVDSKAWLVSTSLVRWLQTSPRCLFLGDDISIKAMNKPPKVQLIRQLSCVVDSRGLCSKSSHFPGELPKLSIISPNI